MNARANKRRVMHRFDGRFLARTRDVSDLKGMFGTAKKTVSIESMNAAISQCAIQQVIRPSPADQECYARELISPPQPSPALRRAFSRRSKLFVVTAADRPVKGYPLR